MLISLPLTIGTVEGRLVCCIQPSLIHKSDQIDKRYVLFCSGAIRNAMELDPVIQLFSATKATALQAALSNSAAQEAELVSRKRLLK